MRMQARDATHRTRMCHLSLHIGDGETSGPLFADNGTETGLGLDNAVWDTTSLAQAGQPADDLNCSPLSKGAAASRVGGEVCVHFMGWTA